MKITESKGVGLNEQGDGATYCQITGDIYSKDKFNAKKIWA